MYPINDIDAQLLLATLIAAKRRPAELVEIVAAADVLGCPVESGNLWAESFRRCATCRASSPGSASNPSKPNWVPTLIRVTRRLILS